MPASPYSDRPLPRKASQHALKNFNSALWPFGWAVLLAAGWLLPNHYPPWISFHIDAWVAAVMMAATFAALAVTTARMPWHGTALVASVMVMIPGLQFVFGLVPIAGNAWVSSAYGFGFLLALLTGAQWESLRSSQLMGWLFIAIGAAAILSVGLQLHQWLILNRLEYLSMGGGSFRPYANLGQPNQLGTFLLWGVVAAAWGYLRKQIGGVVACCMVLYLLFGVALTASRTAWIGVVVLVLGAWYWRSLWPDRRVPSVTTVLAGCFFVFVWQVPAIHGWLLLGAGDSDLESLVRMSGDLRLQAWTLFLDAALQQPWFGYGWNQVTAAHVAVAVDHPPLHVYFSQSHNLFLDLVLWCGIPLGLAIAGWFVWWFGRRLRMVRTAENVVLMLLLLVVANHAMLEFPLHYAYIFLPVGLVMGALEVRMGVRPVLYSARWLTLVLCLVGSALLGLIVRDYLRVEASYQRLRFEWANIKTIPAQPPDVLLLDQWRDFVRVVRLEPTTAMSAADLQWMRNLAVYYASPALFQKLALALALNQRPEEAALWLSRACKVVPRGQCEAINDAWKIKAQNSPDIAAVPWPSRIGQ